MSPLTYSREFNDTSVNPVITVVLTTNDEFILIPPGVALESTTFPHETFPTTFKFLFKEQSLATNNRLFKDRSLFILTPPPPPEFKDNDDIDININDTEVDVPLLNDEIEVVCALIIVAKEETDVDARVLNNETEPLNDETEVDVRLLNDEIELLKEEIEVDVEELFA